MCYNSCLFNTCFISEVSLWISCCSTNWCRKHLIWALYFQNCCPDWIRLNLMMFQKSVSQPIILLVMIIGGLAKFIPFPHLMQYRLTKELISETQIYCKNINYCRQQKCLIRKPVKVFSIHFAKQFQDRLLRDFFIGHPFQETKWKGGHIHPPSKAAINCSPVKDRIEKDLHSHVGSHFILWLQRENSLVCCYYSLF